MSIQCTCFYMIKFPFSKKTIYNITVQVKQEMFVKEYRCAWVQLCDIQLYILQCNNHNATLCVQYLPTIISLCSETRRSSCMFINKEEQSCIHQQRGAILHSPTKRSNLVFSNKEEQSCIHQRRGVILHSATKRSNLAFSNKEE